MARTTPLEYGGFEGTIPEGQYGAGRVEIWDKGTWAPIGDAGRALAAGELKFTLQGERLTGGFVLVRLKPRPKEKAENWLLIKEHDTAWRDGLCMLAHAPVRPWQRRWRGEK